MEGDIWANFGSVATNSQVKIFFTNLRGSATSTFCGYIVLVS